MHGLLCLQKFVKDLHSNLDQREQFKASESYGEPNSIVTSIISFLCCRYTSQHNTGVKSALIADAKARFVGAYSPARVKSKCVGRYKSLMLCMYMQGQFIVIMRVVADCLMIAGQIAWSWLSKPGVEVGRLRTKRQYVAFCHLYTYILFLPCQLYNKRQNYVKGDDERAKWAELGPAYMTEESEAEGDVIRQHPLKWRSQGGAPACVFYSCFHFCRVK